MGERNTVYLAFLKQNRAVKFIPCLRYPDPGSGLLHKRGEYLKEVRRLVDHAVCDTSHFLDKFRYNSIWVDQVAKGSRLLRRPLFDRYTAKLRHALNIEVQSRGFEIEYPKRLLVNIEKLEIQPLIEFFVNIDDLHSIPMGVGFSYYR